ncbi:proline rich transmembrane protein 1B-like [Pleurodeles waltl]|uniref:proline rich transmembrane protein 1B-like n=1 Tax=Pleurodeles waltl TaxID=8319 RepID=UPI003709AF42
MSDFDTSKEIPPPFNPGYPPVDGAGPMHGANAKYGSPPYNATYGSPPYNATYGSPPYNPGYPYGNSAVVTTQPMVIVAPARAYETDYLGYSIFTMLCCCLPIGIGALIYSIKTRDANNNGDADQARKLSRTALTLNNVALGLGIAITVAWVAYVIYLSVVVRQYINNQING